MVTPDRLKQTQLCHVNMLKPYVERSRDPVLPPENVNVVVSEPKEDLGSELSSNSFGPTDTTRLTNTDVLRTWIPCSLTYQRVNARTWGSFCWSLSTCFRMFPQGQIRSITTLMLASKNTSSKYLLENDFNEPSNSSWSSPSILVPKPDGSYRMCTDYRKVNSVTKTDTFPIPRMDDCIDKVGKAKYVTKFDLLKGFWQVPSTDRAKEISAFVTPDGFLSKRHNFILV